MVNGGDDMKVMAGRRLRRTRLALGFLTIRHFAHATGVGESNIAKWESGFALVPPWFVERLRMVYKISHDWIYGGDTYLLPTGLAGKIAEVGNSNFVDEDEHPTGA